MKLAMSQELSEDLRQRLAEETRLRQLREDEIHDLNAVMENERLESAARLSRKQNDCDNRQGFSILLAFRLTAEIRRFDCNLRLTLKNLSSMTSHRDKLQHTLAGTKENLADTKRSLAESHRTISLHLKANDDLRARVAELEKWCIRAHNHRTKFEHLIKMFENELSAAQDAIWAQAVRNDEMREALTQLVGDQLKASEVRAVMLERLQLSEMRRLELEQRFSSLARASTPLLARIRESSSIASSFAEGSGAAPQTSEISRNAFVSHNKSLLLVDEIEAFESIRQPKKWISPYLDRIGEIGPAVNRPRPVHQPRKPMLVRARAQLQQKSLLRKEENRLLDPKNSKILFIGANAHTNVVPVTWLHEKGYQVHTVESLQELAKLSAMYGPEEVMHNVHVICCDLNLVRFSVEFLMRALGGNELLGKEIAKQDVSIVALSSHNSQREDCASQPGMFFVLKPPKRATFDLVIRAALSRRFNLVQARERRDNQNEWSPTPDAATDHVRAGLLNETAQLRRADISNLAPSPLALPFPHPLRPTSKQRPGSRARSRMSSRASSRAESRSQPPSRPTSSGAVLKKERHVGIPYP